METLSFDQHRGPLHRSTAIMACPRESIPTRVSSMDVMFMSRGVPKRPGMKLEPAILGI
jgi:hypothetical protein